MTTLMATDLEKAREYFAFTRGRLVEVTSGLTDAQARFKPAANCWSIADILDHLVTVHQRVMTRLVEQFPHAPAPEPGRDSRTVDALVLEKIPDRSIKAEAPEFAHPKSAPAPAESLGRIFRSYDRLIEFLETTADLREHIMDSPPLRVVTKGACSTADGYQWALTAAAHDERHVRQILELKAAPGYPA